MTCQDFFDVHLHNNDKCKLLQKERDKYAWQQETASRFSPLPVQDEESLIRQIISPIHLDNDSKTLKPTAFDDVFNKGLSVNRFNFITNEAQVIGAASLKTKAFNAINPAKPQRELHALTRFFAVNIRSLTDYENKFGLGIYDTALELDSSHADICHVSIDSKQNQRSIRSKLLDLANKNLTVI